MYQNRQSDFLPADPQKPKRGNRAEISFGFDAKAQFLTALALHSDAPPSAVKVAAVLMVRHNQKAGTCNPSTEGIAEDTGLGRQAVSKAVNWLRTHEFFTVKTVRHGNRQDRNTYVPNLSKAAFTLADLASEKRKAAEKGPAQCRQEATLNVPQCRREATPSVAFRTGSASPKSDSNKEEGDKEEINKEESASCARDTDLVPAEVALKPVKVPLPTDLAFPAEAIAAARARGLDDGDVAAAMSAFRHANAADQRTPAGWMKGAAGWLGCQKARPPGTAARITPERPADPSDAEGTRFGGFDTDDERLRQRAMAMPERVFQAAHRAFLDHYGDDGEGKAATSCNWNETWLAWTQHAWDMEKLNRAKSKFTPPRPAI